MSRESSFLSRSSATSVVSACFDVGFGQADVEAVAQPQIPAPLGDQDRSPHLVAQIRIALEQRQDLLGARRRAHAHHQRQAQQAGIDVGLEHGPVAGDHRDAAVLLPQREGLALLDADLQPIGIELEDRGIRDPGIGLEPVARRVDIEKQQRGGAGHARGAENFLAADVPLAGQRDRGDAEAGRIGGGIARILEGIDDRGTRSPTTVP